MKTPLKSSSRDIEKDIIDNLSQQLMVEIDRQIIDSANDHCALIVDVGTVYGSRYYTVEPIGGNWREMETWCTEIFGERYANIWGDTDLPSPKPAQRWYANNRKFWFKEQKDRDWFVLRWS